MKTKNTVQKKAEGEKIRVKGYLKDEYRDISTIGDGSEPKSILSFKWAKLNKDSYLVVLPKIFRKQAGDEFTIISSKAFLRLLNRNKDL